MIIVVHGGQTGVDRGAHEAAIDSGWRVSGYMPRDGRDELGAIPPEVARHLIPCDKAGYPARTAANVRISDALLIVAQRAASPEETPGTARTLELASGRSLRHRVVDADTDPGLIAGWIWQDLLAGGRGQIVLFDDVTAPSQAAMPRLLVAGPRSSKWPAAQEITASFLRAVNRALIAQALAA